MTASLPRRQIDGPITPERFARLTKHLRVNGKPVESVLHRLENVGRGVSWDRPSEQDAAA
jgi:hypothetical protein